MILLTDAVVDPRAMVVVPFDALVAGRAVAGARRSDGFALRTEMNGVHHRHEFLPQGQKHFITYQKVDSLRPFDIARVCKLGPNPEQDSAEAEDSTNMDRILQVPN